MNIINYPNTKITVFTPTFNREYCLPQLYESLVRQNNQNFIWLIIDDGSTDNTANLVKNWTRQGKIKIFYVYKDNGGMHSAHNRAYELISTELNVCVDSDDYMPDNAIELILNIWSNTSEKDKYAGIIGLDVFTDGSIVGTRIPENVFEGTLMDLYVKYGVKGDKKIILRTSIVKKYPPYPEYKFEKLVPLGTLYTMIGADYPCIYSNNVFCIVDYQPDGSSNTILNQYKQSPKGFAYARKIHIKYAPNIFVKLKGYAHLVSSALFAKDISIAFTDVVPLLTILMFPFGVILNIYIKIKSKK